MGAFQRLSKGRPWGESHSPWHCWACRPCWWCRWWRATPTSTSPCWAPRPCSPWSSRPSTTSTMATRPKSCRSSLRIRRLAWLWRRWSMTGQIVIAGCPTLFLYHLRHLLLLTQPQPQPRPRQQQPQQRPPPPQQRNILHRRLHLPPLPHPRPRPPPHPLHPRHRPQQQQRALEILGSQAQTMWGRHQFSGWRQQPSRVQCSWTPRILLRLTIHQPPKLKIFHQPSFILNVHVNAGRTLSLESLKRTSVEVISSNWSFSLGSLTLSWRPDNSLHGKVKNLLLVSCIFHL